MTSSQADMRKVDCQYRVSVPRRWHRRKSVKIWNTRLKSGSRQPGGKPKNERPERSKKRSPTGQGWYGQSHDQTIGVGSQCPDWRAPHGTSLQRTWASSLEQSVGPDFTTEAKIHIRDEHSTYDWIIEGVLRQAGFKVDSAKYSHHFGATCLCTRIGIGN